VPRSAAGSTSRQSAEPFVPNGASIPELAAAANECRGCDLYKDATQAVFGVGLTSAKIILVGEQPGDQEDLQGQPFVGPAGMLLNRALEEAGIARDTTYVTNAVKHFKFEPRGKRRIHKKPGVTEVRACRPWLAAEIQAVKPSLIVCLGATAAQALFGPTFKLTQQRGQVLPGPDGIEALATIHPSAVLRMPDADSRDRAFQSLVADLRVVANEQADGGLGRERE
jgi:uracil-DNA glycosylase family protein